MRRKLPSLCCSEFEQVSRFRTGMHIANNHAPAVFVDVINEPQAVHTSEFRDVC